MKSKLNSDLEFRVEGDFTYGLANPDRLPEYVLNDDFESRLHANSLRMIGKKYLKRDNSGNIVQSPRERVYDIARLMAEVEGSYEANQEQIDNFTKEFYKMISNLEFAPGGRVWSNANTSIGALFNCYVLPVLDSIEGIFTGLKHQALIQKEGGGTGYNFSEIRPRGTYVIKSKAVASGVVSFIGQFDKATEVINSGNRRGANMGILDVDHPDILDFIYSKSVRGELTNFNISIGATNDFMEAMESDGYYKLNFNGNSFTCKDLVSIVENIEIGLGGAEVGQKPRPPSLIFSENGEKIIDTYTGDTIGKAMDGEIYLHAGKIMSIITELAHKTGDPGMIFLDSINRDNPLINTTLIKATNPCGEQPLHPYDACNLGSINLEKMVMFDEEGATSVDYNKIRRVTRSAVRFMDNVNDANVGPIDEVEKTVLNHRRIGLGVMGWHDMLVQLGIQYDSQRALDLAEKVMTFISSEAKKMSHELAEEKGVFPIWDKSTYAETGKEEDRVRNLQRTTIAPTGTIAMLYDVSSGIEPFFALAYTKNIRGGEVFQYFNRHFEKIARERGFWSESFRREVEIGRGSVQNIEEIPNDVKTLFKGSYEIEHKWHVAMQAAFQRGTDNAISKTINMVNSVTSEDIKEVYIDAWKKDLKGITIYRDGSKEVQVLEVNKEEEFDLLNGERPEVVGTTKKVKTGHGNIFVTMNKTLRGDMPYETFVNHGKSGSITHAYTEALGRVLSLALKHKISVKLLVEELEGIEADIRYDNGKKILSAPDGIAQEMGEFFLGNKGDEDLESKISGDEEAIGQPCFLTAGCRGTVIKIEGCKMCSACGESLC